ncbi:MAG: hypothetical protein Q9217_004027 [Psora testacea]
MHYSQIIAALAFTSVVTAAPFEQKRATSVTGNKKFTLEQTGPKQPGKKLAGPIALAQALGKYNRVGLSASQSVKAAASKAAATDDGTVAASPEQYDQAYLSAVTIGGQTLNLDFDTGSADLWTFSSELSASEQNGHNIYTPGSSATKLNGQTWAISYGDGSSASGDVYTDTVDVGGTTVDGQAVELASTISAQFVRDQSDGLLGLSFSSINTVTPDQQKTFFDNALPSLSSPLFAVNLKKGQPGTYDFGFVDDSKHTGEITYTTVDNSRGFWGFTTSGYKVGDGSMQTENINSIADTGTSLLLLQDDVVDAYWGAVQGAQNSQSEGGYVFPCDTTLPDITFQIEGYAAVVPGSYVNYAPASESGTCYGGIQSSGGLGLSIFGDVFLKSQFVVFSNDGPQLGFAPKNL